MNNYLDRIPMPSLLRPVLFRLWLAFKDLLPIVIVIGFFQLAVLRQPLPNLFESRCSAACWSFSA